MIKALKEYQVQDAKLREIEKVLAGSEERKKAVTAKKYLEGVEESVNKLDLHAAELKASYEKILSNQEKLKAQQAEKISFGGIRFRKEILKMVMDRIALILAIIGGLNWGSIKKADRPATPMAHNTAITTSSLALGLRRSKTRKKGSIHSASTNKAVTL